MFRQKRGQAAMEFLMTYGWAILAAVIVVGVLWYMIGNPSNLAGDRFQLSAPLVGNAMTVSATGIEMEIRNGGADSITVSSVAVDGCTTNSSGFVVAAGQLNRTGVTCTLTSGDRVNSDITISYTTSGSSLTQSASGTITAQVP